MVEPYHAFSIIVMCLEVNSDRSLCTVFSIYFSKNIIVGDLFLSHLHPAWFPLKSYTSIMLSVLVILARWEIHP